MTPPANTERYKNHRFPGEIISHGVWLYYRFNLSYESMEILGEHRPMLNKRTRAFGTQEIGIGRRLTASPLPHHQAYGSVP
jgi:hypothetical protein